MRIGFLGTGKMGMPLAGQESFPVVARVLARMAGAELRGAETHDG